MEITGIQEGQVISIAGHSDRERIARLEANMENLSADVSETRKDVKVLISKFDQLTGGKRAMLTIASLAGIVVGIIVSVFSGITRLGHIGH